MAKYDINNPKDVALMKSMKTPQGDSVYDAYMKELLTGKGNTSIKNKKLTTGNERGAFSKKKEKIVRYGIEWDSNWEADVYAELVKLEKANIISHLIIKPARLICELNGVVICQPSLDFMFTYKDNMYYADAKSKWWAKSRGWTLVKKIIKAIHGIDVVTFYQDYNNVLEVIEALD